MKQRLSTNLEAMSLYQARMLAADAGVNVNDVIETGLELLFHACEQAERPGRKAPILSVGVADAKRKLGLFDDGDREAFLRLAAKSYDPDAARRAEVMVMGKNL